MSQNPKLLKNLWRFLRPEAEELIFYTLAIITLSSIAFYQVAVQGRIGVESQDLIASFGTAKETLDGFFNGEDVLGRFFLFGFWFIIGTLTYIISWSLITLAVDTYNDIRVSKAFVHPRSFHQSDFWVSIMGRAILRVTSGVALTFYGVFWLIAFAPVWLNSIASAISRGISSETVIDLVAALAGVAFTLHIGAILLRLMLLRAHYAYEDWAY